MVIVPTVAGSGSVRPGLAFFMCPDPGSGNDDGGSVTWPSPSTQSLGTLALRAKLRVSGLVRGGIGEVHFGHLQRPGSAA